MRNTGQALPGLRNNHQLLPAFGACPDATTVTRRLVGSLKMPRNPLDRQPGNGPPTAALSAMDPSTLTDRQRREYEYHRLHAQKNGMLAQQPMSWEVLDRPQTRWWNAYWQMYSHLKAMNLQGRDVLVVGCGFGEDALRIAKLGARVKAFDLSPEALNIARQRAKKESLDIEFDEMPAEVLRYGDRSFDCVVARDILHHVDIPKAMSEIRRTARPGAVFLMNEIYTHSRLQAIRKSRFVERVIYERMKAMVYGSNDVYITADERKLDEHDLAAVHAHMQSPRFEQHFNFLVTRVVPDRFDVIAKADRLLMKALRPWGHLLAGRIMLAAEFRPDA
jgi:ubiquinone/menaquinone biosynthesis C-methylase UbiE